MQKKMFRDWGVSAIISTWHENSEIALGNSRDLLSEMNYFSHWPKFVFFQIREKNDRQRMKTKHHRCNKIT